MNSGWVKSSVHTVVGCHASALTDKQSEEEKPIDRNGMEIAR